MWNIISPSNHSYYKISGDIYPRRHLSDLKVEKYDKVQVIPYFYSLNIIRVLYNKIILNCVVLIDCFWVLEIKIIWRPSSLTELTSY